jgi:AbrB family looped-hinge helix DNA binding protein
MHYIQPGGPCPQTAKRIPLIAAPVRAFFADVTGAWGVFHADYQKFSISDNMFLMTRETLIVSERGQITLPKALRDRLALRPGTALIAEERNGQLVLKPAVVTPVRIYTDKEVQAWLKDDQVSPSIRKKILDSARSKH